MILALETSCDDTCAAVVSADGAIGSNIISSQRVHDDFGGVVPEYASRHHLANLRPVIDQALETAGTTLDQIKLVAATRGPGLTGALLVGFQTAKALAAARQLPFAPVDHLQGHVAASYLKPLRFEPPFLCLIASGGHTLLVDVTEHSSYETLGTTLDDAAGEAFDKGARLLGLGFPGGPALSKAALDGDPMAFDFPISHGVEGLNFSFSGVKTALLYCVRDLGEHETERRTADLAASYERAIVEALVLRVQRAISQRGVGRVAIGGGVAANHRLRERLGELGVEIGLPTFELCTDNAAMIASAARYTDVREYPDYLALDVYPTGKRPSA